MRSPSKNGGSFKKKQKKEKKLLTKVLKFGNIVIVNKDKDNGRKK